MPGPSKANLVWATSFCLYRVHGKFGKPDARIEVIEGAADARFSDTGKVMLLAGNIPFHSDAMKKRMPAPGVGLTVLSGRTDQLTELQLYRKKARELKCEFAYVEYELDVGEIPAVFATRELLKKWREEWGGVRYLSLRRTQTSLQDEIRSELQKYVVQEGGRPEEMAEVVQIATRPDLLFKLFSDDPELKALSLFMTVVADDPANSRMVRQIGLLRPGAQITQVRQGSDQVDVLLPTWLQDAELARKFRETN